MGIEHRLTSKSQVTIPKDVRAALGIKPGDLVRFEHDKNGHVSLSKGQDRQAETPEQKKLRIRAALESAQGSIDLGGKTTDEFMLWLRGDWEP